MNRDEQFENRLRHQPLRKIPPAWRAEILSAAHEATASGHSLPTRRQSSWWRELFWPHPAAWASLAGVWLVMFGVQFVSRDASPQVFSHVPRPSRQMRELLKQQEQLFAELVGPKENREADRPESVAPPPRSLRREETLNA